MIKLITICGTRPELIRLSRIIPKLDKLCHHTFVHTGQNHDPLLKDIFFRDLDIRQPDISWEIVTNTLSGQVAAIMQRTEETLREAKPDRLLILGDTNSALSSYIARRMNIPIYHMEAGNRCHDSKSPEEANRLAIDHWSTILMPYTERSRANLLVEGIPAQNIFVTGNPIHEVMRNQPETNVLSQLGLGLLSPRSYFLATLHREENVDNPTRLSQFLAALDTIHSTYNLPVLLSCHPRTRKRLLLNTATPNITICEPFSFPDFFTLEKNALCVLTDSGTVQEECCLLHTPTVTLRDTTERPETIECGSNILSGSDLVTILNCLRAALASPRTWRVPSEYLIPDVSNTVCKIVLGYQHKT